MVTKYVTLTLHIIEFSDSDPDGPSSRELRFEGHKNWSNMNFAKGIPTAREIELLAQLSSIVTELHGQGGEVRQVQRAESGGMVSDDAQIVKQGGHCISDLVGFVTDEQIARVIDLFAGPEEGPDAERWGMDTTLGSTKQLIGEIRRILEAP